MPVSIQSSNESMSDPLVQVLRGLSSSPDGVLFSQDVCVQYPHLAAEYKARFPHRIDLGTMAQRAKDGQYRKSAVAAGAATVVAEVRLMVNNCLAYNLGNTYLEDQAIRFRTQALAALDKHFRTTGDALAHLLHLLSKTDNGSIFAKDVCEEFPDLAAQYKSMFPVRTDLGAMQKKAMSGSYKTLRQVQTDLDVMVNNCLRFNGEATHLGRQARSFHSQARRSLEKYFSIDGGVESWTVVSSSSPPTPHELSTPTTASVAALPTSRKRGRAEDSNNSDDVIVVNAGGEPLPAAAAPQRTTATTTATSWMTPDNLKNLIAALDRPQDNGMFATAVAKAYPEIAEQYSRVCPAPMDLDFMRTKATRKQYTSVTQLLDDVTLIAKNCVTYNGVGHPLAESAASFLKDATAIIQYAQDHHGAINKPAPVTMSAAAVAGTSSSGLAEQVVQQQDEIVPLDTISTTAAPTGPVDTAILPLTPDLTALVQPKEKVLVTPRVALLAHQLPMRIPNAIRENIITRHLHQLHHQHPRNSREGSEVHAATDNKDGNIEERSEHFFLPQGHPSTVANVVEAFIAALKQREMHLNNSADALVNTAKDHQSIVTGETVSSLKVEVSEASLSSSLPLDDATRALARTLECREHLAKAAGLMQLLADVFDAAFLNVLLYRNERHLVDSWVATKLEAGALEAHSNNNYPWSRIAHVELFIRLLLHIPQLGAVTAALASSPQIGEGVRVLYRHAKEVPLDAATKGVVATVCIPLVEDFLCYAESRWDELSERR